MARETFEYSIEVNPFQLAAIRQELGTLAFEMPKILRTAANKTVRDANSAVASFAAMQLTAKRGVIRRRLRVVSARQIGEDAIAALRVRAKRIALTEFKLQDTAAGKRGKGGAGVIVEKFRGQPTRFPHSFLAASRRASQVKLKGAKRNKILAAAGMAPGSANVFQSIHRSFVFHRKGKKRYPLRVDKGIALIDLYAARPEAHKITVQTIHDKLPKYIRSQTDWILSQYRRPASVAAA